MQKRIVAVTREPHTVSLIDREVSLFIDTKSGNIFADEGDGIGRMNGVVFTPNYQPIFSITSATSSDHALILNYVGTEYLIGNWSDFEELDRWVASANALLFEKRSIVKPDMARRPTQIANAVPEINLSSS